MRVCVGEAVILRSSRSNTVLYAYTSYRLLERAERAKNETTKLNLGRTYSMNEWFFEVLLLLPTLQLLLLSMGKQAGDQRKKTLSE